MEEERPTRLAPRLELGLGCLFLGLSGCVAGTAESALLERASNERSCTADQLRVISLGASAYRVEGCGPPETFVCVSYQGWVYTKEGGPQSSLRVLRAVAALAARRVADEARTQITEPQLIRAVPNSAPPFQSPPLY